MEENTIEQEQEQTQEDVTASEEVPPVYTDQLTTISMQLNGLYMMGATIILYLIVRSVYRFFSSLLNEV